MSITAITMPKWGLTMTEGKVVGWLLSEGAGFAKGDELVEIETSKITNVMEADGDGRLARIVAPKGSALPIGGLLAVVAPAGTPDAEIDAFVAGFVVPETTDADEAAAAEAEPAFVEAGGVRLRYLAMGDGDGTPVLLLHGFSGDLNSWMFNQPSLASGRRTIALDLPGHGGSAKDTAAAAAPTAMTAAVIAAMDALGLTKTHLIGHSMGGALAALVARQVPGRVASLTLIAPAGLGRKINAAFIDGITTATRRKDAEAALRLLVHDPAMVTRTMVEDMLRYKRLDGVDAALGAIATAWFPGGRQAVNIGAMLAELPMPVQVIWGEQDQIVSPADRQALPPAIAQHDIADTGHLPHMEKAAAVNALIAAFVTE